MGYALNCEIDKDMHLDGRVRFHRFRYHLAAGFVTPEDRVLDIGCGTGYGSEILSKPAMEVLSYDKDQANIDYAELKHEIDNVHYFCANVEDFDFDHADVAVAFEVLEHMYTPKDFVRKLKDKVRKYIIVSVPLDQILIHVNGDPQEAGDSTHHSVFTKQSFMDMFWDDDWKEFWSFRDGVTLIAVFFNKNAIT